MIAQWLIATDSGAERNVVAEVNALALGIGQNSRSGHHQVGRVAGHHAGDVGNDDEIGPGIDRLNIDERKGGRGGARHIRAVEQPAIAQAATDRNDTERRIASRRGDLILRLLGDRRWRLHNQHSRRAEHYASAIADKDGIETFISELDVLNRERRIRRIANRQIV